MNLINFGRVKLLLLLIASSLLAGCSITSLSTPNQITELQGDAEEQEIVKLQVMVVEPGAKWNQYPDNAIAQEIAKRIGVEIEYVEVDAHKFNVILAGGKLPDMIRVNSTQYGRQLIEGNLIIPMDGLLEAHGRDMAANVPSVIEYSRKHWSQDLNKLYFIPPQVQLSPSPVYKSLSIGPTIRWDAYKAIGTPDIRSSEDLLHVLAQIVEKYPLTDEGKKVYGVSMWQDWGLWPYIYPFVWETTQTTDSSELMARKLGENRYTNILTEVDSTYWLAMSFYNKAKRKGLLDPDALTMKYNDYFAKATAGQIVFGPAVWAMGDFNAKHARDGKGFMVLPVGKRAWSGGVNPIGWPGKSYAISASSKHPEKAMQLLNFMYSYEGARIMYSGIEGVHWEWKDGKPQLKRNTIELGSMGGAAWEETGIALDLNLIGLGGSVLDPATQTPVDLFSTPESLRLNQSNLEKDFSRHFGGSHPGEVFAAFMREGRLVDSNTPLKELSEEEVITQGTVVFPTLTKELLKLEAELKELASRASAKMILSKTEDEFEKNKQETIQMFKTAGADKITEFYHTVSKHE